MKAKRLPRQLGGGGTMKVSCRNRRREPVRVDIARHRHHVQLLRCRCPVHLL